MSDVVLTVQPVPREGLDLTDVSIDATDVYFVKNARGVFLHFKNTGGSPSTVTIDTVKQVDGLDLENPTINVPATTGDIHVAAIPESWLDDVTNPGSIKFSQDQASGVTVAVGRA